MLPAWDKLWCHLWDLWKCPKHRAAWLQVSEKERKMWCWYFHFQISCGNNPKPPSCVCCLLSIEPRDGCRNIGCTAIFSQDLPESFPHSLATSAPSHLWLIRPSMQPMLQRGLTPQRGPSQWGISLTNCSRTVQRCDSGWCPAGLQPALHCWVGLLWAVACKASVEHRSEGHSRRHSRPSENELPILSQFWTQQFLCGVM